MAFKVFGAPMRASVALGLAAWLAAGGAHAATIAGVTPQGEVAQVRQVVVSFSEGVVPLGDLRLPDPAIVSCQGPAPAGSGRWLDDRRWAWDFRAALPPGVRCTVKARADWKPMSGVLSGRSEFAFQTGGPAIVNVQPWGGEIEEEPYFLLRLSGAAVEATVLANARCEVEGIGERIPVRVIGGAERAALLKARRLEKQPELSLVLACQRPLPQDTPVRLVWGRGIAAASNPQVLTSVEQRFDYRVRKRFTAEFSCERERADAPCLPVRPMSVRFSAPVPREQAAAVRLEPASGKALAPVFATDDRNDEVTAVNFPVPLAEGASFRVVLPAGLKDVSGRALANAASFPLTVATGTMPPIAKFAAAPFGIVERGEESMLPVTLRHVQGDLRPAAPQGAVRVKTLSSDADILAWFARLDRYHERQMSAREAGLPQSEWTVRETQVDARGRTHQIDRERIVGTRELSLLKSDAQAKRLDLPQLAGGDPRPFEVVGIPLAEPGYHVVEIESQRLGESLLDKKAPLYVRTGVLVTNLGVHFKRGRENSLVWVTTLDRGRPVEGAEVAVRDCAGKALWSGRTDANGIARVDRVLDAINDCPHVPGYFVSARHTGKDGRTDVAFTLSSWQRGIESWRFNVPTDSSPHLDLRSHTVFDRTLLRAGETVSMKHFVRTETSGGLASLKPADLPGKAIVIHQGTGQEFALPLAWNGVRSATSSWNIPPAAKLGVYEVVLERTPDGDERRRTRLPSGSFRIEEFRLPLIDARLAGPKGAAIAPKELPLDVQLNFFSGGGLQTAARASALLRPRYAIWPGYEEFSFEPPRRVDGAGSAPPDDEAPDDDTGAPRDGKLVADKLAVQTDRNGAARITLKDLPAIDRASELTAELSFNDPNGEVQTASTRVALWPSAVVLGVKTGAWASRRGKVKFQVVALDTTGKPMAGQKVEVRGRHTQYISTRKRMVGGFYAYDNRSEVKDLGALCSGQSDARGLVLCEAELSTPGQVELIARASDAEGCKVEAASSVWVTRQGELWFAQDNDDRIDVLPEKKAYEPGETARFQVRMPYREATALVSVEREGIVDTRVITLRGDDPTFELPIPKPPAPDAASWGPNVYVSVLALRGRIRDVPWYSFFRWGWREPVNWWRAFWYEGREYQAPTAMVDLAKPSFKLGVAPIRIGIASHKLQVTVSADKESYAIRQTAKAKVKVTHGGKPLAGSEFAFAAVDEGLLSLKPNDSWDLLGAMIQQRSWGVETSTAQGEIVGRRHYGRKAVAAGGGGGRGQTRELFDTLLVWKPAVTLDANGEAIVEVPLNDSLTSFKLVAVADAGVQTFGSGSTSIRVTQDLQALSGLPPLVREGDRFQALLTLRNTTAREMKVKATLSGTARSGPEVQRAPIALTAQEHVLAAGATKEIAWEVTAPTGADSVTWEAAVDEVGGAAKDRLKVTQLVVPAVPLRVMQATLAQLDGAYSLAVAPPADALSEAGIPRGSITLGLQPKLTGALPGVRRFFETYPFICLEQKFSKAVGLRDPKLWTAVANVLPTYLDRDGLANYFPPRPEDAPRGSDRLTAYLIAAADEAGFELPTAARDEMLAGLTLFVEGRIKRDFWSPQSAKGIDLDVRKLAALAALSRHGRASARQLGSINLAPNLWPTAALIDWLTILRRVDGVPDRAKRLDEAQQLLRSRLTWSGTTLRFSTEQEDFWWWLMDSADANAARLILAVLDDAAWKEELPRLVIGSLGRQRYGHWLTTTANVWGSLALDKFSARFESQPVAGRTSAQLAGAQRAFDWAGANADGGRLALPWPAKEGQLAVQHAGSGKPWLTVQSLAAVPLAAPIRAGYDIVRTVTPVEQKVAGRWSRGDIARVRIEVEAQSDMTWVVVSDPVPAGATLLGSGLGRDSEIATRGEKREGWSWPAFEERGFEAFRSYYDYLPRGKHVIEYSVRLNNPGRFALPPTRVEAMYAPEAFGELPNAALEVQP
ncbi:alpha-2-macroglobulin family protein [Caldimonas sp. KR1-144]|uniref:alpha-2-macroglobulin family protein n=1 Tax=Caldimonas sp. KR1-144 TaxID=3400911 RepID=UPI003C063319